MSETLQLAIDLLSRASVTPADKGCQDVMIQRLEASGFSIERLTFDDVDNFWAIKGSESPVIVFAGHTDVVPTGPESAWLHPPFSPTIDQGKLYARGAADMKSSLAAMIVACEQFIAQYPDFSGSIAFLITSDEEGPSINGTVKVVEYLQQQQQQMDYCIVGEPSSTQQLGDIIKNGRRGSLNAKLIVHGTQGHVAYPHLANNPVHSAAQALADLCAQTWDQGNQYFPPTTFQISNIHAGTGVSNVIPGDLEVLFNFRFSTAVTDTLLKQRVEAILQCYPFEYSIEWTLSGQPFLTEQGKLVSACQNAIKRATGIDTQLSTSGGTSDGRFIAPTGTQVVEIGPLNATIHQINEYIDIKDLDPLSKIYQYILEDILL